jgi:hypothetical protein
VTRTVNGTGHGSCRNDRASLVGTAAAHASTATAAASLYFLSAWYFSAPPFRNIFLHICLWPRRQWSCWRVESQYLSLHLTHRGALWASGAAQAAQFVRSILRFAVSYRACAALDWAGKTRFVHARPREPLTKYAIDATPTPIITQSITP